MVTRVNNRMIDNAPIDITNYGVLTTNDAATNSINARQVIRNENLSRRRIFFPEGDYRFGVFNPNNCIIEGDNTTMLFEQVQGESVVFGQFTNCEVRNIRFESTEEDLAQQRCTSGESDFYDCQFVGFRNPGPMNSWGIYFQSQTRNRLVRCGFGNNTQSDIAVVGDAKYVTIEQCYSIDNVNDKLHINFEPNSSTDNNIATLEGMEIGRLDLLENGSGGTANRSINIKGCTIDNLVYDGATTSFDSCQIAAIGRAPLPFGGKVSFENTLGLGPNLIDDPYLIANAFNQSQGVSNNQEWFMRTRLGSITGGGRTLGNEQGNRYFSLNSTGTSGVIRYQLVDNISVTQGDTYCVVLTGRGRNNNGAQHLTILDGSTEINTRSHRQSNSGEFEFSTEVFFFVASSSTASVIIQNSLLNTTEGFDFKAVSLHRVNFSGTNFKESVARVHDQRGAREIFLSNLPSSNPADQTGFQVGDEVVTPTVVNVWDGAAFRPLWT